VVSFFDPHGLKQIRIARAWAKMLLRIAGVRVSVEGIDKISMSGSYVFAANHVSYMDTPVIFSYIPVQFRFLAKVELFAWPFIGDHLKRAGHIAVPRESRAALKAMSDAGRTVRERGISLLVFPEGGRSESGELQEFKDGASYLAIKAGVPIVPVAISGMHKVLPMHGALIRPGNVTIRIGDPISTTGLTLHDRGRLTQKIYERVKELQCASLPVSR
jgi:1-acyl-sn-glycerol-3-phosphate acyltransferase